MSKKKAPIKLTHFQREILEAMRNGADMIINESNSGWVGDHPIGFETYNILLDKGFVVQMENASSKTSKERSYRITDEGLSLVNSLPPLKPKPLKKYTPAPATENQIEYGRDLGIDFPPNVNIDEARDLISAKLSGDRPANDHHRLFAKMFGAFYTSYTGKRELFDRIFNQLNRPTHEKDLCAWFVYRVYRHLVHGSDSAPITGPDHPIIQEIAQELVRNDAIVQSIQNYKGRNLIWFGKYTNPDGESYFGGTEGSPAYIKTSELLYAKGIVPNKEIKSL